MRPNTSLLTITIISGLQLTLRRDVKKNALILTVEIVNVLKMIIWVTITNTLKFIINVLKRNIDVL